MNIKVDYSANLTTESNDDSLTIYLKKISVYPLLTREEELILGRKIAETTARLEATKENYFQGELSFTVFEAERKHIERQLRKLTNRMITSNLRLVVSIAKRYQNRGLGLLDLINEGNLGLLKGIERFDYRKGYKFSTYGSWWIQQAITKAIADKSRVIRIPIHVLSQSRSFHSALEYLTQELGCEPTPEQAAEFLKIPLEKVQRLLMCNEEVSSLDIAVDEEKETTLSNLLVGESVYKEPAEYAFESTLADVIDKALNRLDTREQDVIRFRFGLNGLSPMTLEEIGKKLGITRERVRQLQNKAMQKLRRTACIKELRSVMD